MRNIVFLLAFAMSSMAMAAETLPADQPSPDPDLANPGWTYQTCLQLSRKQPNKAIELAGKWITLGGGEAARHCQALALVGLQEWGEGATRLEELAVESRQGPAVRANMLAQAGHAWVLQGEMSRAYAAQTTALKIIPQGSRQHVELLLDRAGTLAEAGEYDDALADINAALRVEPNNSQAMAFRASAHRLKGDLDEAKADAEHAVTLGPENVAALLERGNIYRMDKRLEDARKDWLRILELEPDSAEGDAARANIARIDVDTRATVKD